MDRRQVSTDRAPAALGPHSQAIMAGDFVFCSGTAGIDFGVINEIYARHMPDPPPARSAPASIALPQGLLSSIDAIALRGDV